MSREYRNSVMAPIRGSRRYRQRCRIELVDGVFSATNAKGQKAYFPLDGTEKAPTAYLPINDNGKWRNFYLDATGKTIVVIDSLLWDDLEEDHLRKAARLDLPANLSQITGAPPLREDGIELFDITWPFRWAPKLLLGASLAVVLGQFHVVSAGVALAVGSASLVGFWALGWLTGLTGAVRSGRGQIRTRNRIKNEKARDANRAQRGQKRRRT